MPVRSIDTIQPGESRDVALVLGALMAVPIALAAVLARRRRRHRQTSPRRLLDPLPTMLPHVRPYSYPVCRTDGSSVLPDIALAWTDRDVGTCPDTDPHAPERERAPEHA